MPRNSRLSLAFAVIASVLASVAPFASAQAPPRLTFEGEDLFTLQAGASTESVMRVLLALESFACAADAYFPVELTVTADAGVIADVSQSVVHVRVPAGVYASFDANTSFTLFLGVTEGVASGMRTVNLAATLPSGGSPDCTAVNGFEAASANHVLRVDVPSAPEESPPLVVTETPEGNETEGPASTPPANSTAPPSTVIDIETNDTPTSSDASDAESEEESVTPGFAPVLVLGALAATGAAVGMIVRRR